MAQVAAGGAGAGQPAPGSEGVAQVTGQCKLYSSHIVNWM